MKKGLAFLGAIVITIASMGFAEVMAAPSPTAEDTTILVDAVTVDVAQGTTSELSLERVSDANKVIRNIVAEILNSANTDAKVTSGIAPDGTLVLADDEAPLGISVEPELLAAFDFEPSTEIAEKLASKGYVEVEFDVDSVEKGDTIKILHYLEDSDQWEVINPSAVANGKVKAKFTSFSPIVITKIPASVAKLDSSANKGFNVTPVIIVLAVIAVIAAAGAFVCGKNSKTAKNK